MDRMRKENEELRRAIRKPKNKEGDKGQRKPLSAFEGK
jgi:hypothetical protein